MEGVEEEVRLQLSHERVEPSLDQLHLQPLGAPGVIESRDHRVDQQIEGPPDRDAVRNAAQDRMRRAPFAERPF